MIEITTLDNGIVVASDAVDHVHSCTIGIWAQVGSRFEAEEESGLSHFLEHLLFKGTETRSSYEIARDMDAIGGQMNAFTNKERTCYYARVRDQHLGYALELLSDMVTQSNFPEDEVEREREVILEEIKMYEDTPDDQVMQLFSRDRFPTHQLGRPIIGYAEVIRNLSREKIMEYWRHHYQGAKIMVVAAGKLDHKALVEEAQERLGHLSAMQREATKAATVMKGKHVYSRDCEQVYVALGRQGFPANNPDRFKVLVVDSALGGSMSSRLFQEIREKRGLVYSVSSFMSNYLDTGIYGIYAGTSAGKVEELLQVAHSILADMSENGLTQEEFDRAKELLKGGLAMGLETTSSRMMRLSRHLAYLDRPYPVEEVIDLIDKVSFSEANTTASELLNPEAFGSTILGPVTSVAGVEAVAASERLLHPRA